MLITCVRQSAQKSFKQSVIWKSFHCWSYQTKMFSQTAELAHADWKQKRSIKAQARQKVITRNTLNIYLVRVFAPAVL